MGSANLTHNKPSKHRIKQLTLEIHTGFAQHGEPSLLPTAEVLHQSWTKLQLLTTRLGYRRWWSTVNSYGTYNYNDRRRSYGYEMFYINRRFLLPPEKTSQIFVFEMIIF